MAATTANIELTAQVTAITASVDLIANGHVIGTVEVPIDTAHETRAFTGKVVNVHHDGLKGVDLDELRREVQRRAVSKYMGRP